MAASVSTFRQRRKAHPVTSSLPKGLVAKLTVQRIGEEPTEHPLGAGEIVIGRDAGCDLVVVSDQVSRRHCLVYYRGLEFRLRDLSSSNGTFLNGARVVEYALRNGDQVRIGDAVLRFSVRTDIVRSLPHPVPAVR